MNQNDDKSPAAIIAAAAPARAKSTNYPEPFASMMANRIKHPLGDIFGLKNFGVNLTRIRPGGVSALHHRHSRQDEFIYVIEGAPTLCTGADEVGTASRHVRRLSRRRRRAPFGESDRRRCGHSGDWRSDVWR